MNQSPLTFVRPLVESGAMGLFFATFFDFSQSFLKAVRKLFVQGDGKFG